MTTWYCHRCSVARGLVTPTAHHDLLAETYQLGKFLEHTAPTTAGAAKPVNSLFQDTSVPAYSGYYVTTLASGCVQIDDYGRRNMVWFAGEETGFRYESGLFIGPQSGVKLVLYDNPLKVHLSPCDAAPAMATCVDCGNPVPY
jgi:hypothetical protein